MQQKNRKQNPESNHLFPFPDPLPIILAELMIFIQNHRSSSVKTGRKPYGFLPVCCCSFWLKQLQHFPGFRFHSDRTLNINDFIGFQILRFSVIVYGDADRFRLDVDGTPDLFVILCSLVDAPGIVDGNLGIVSCLQGRMLLINPDQMLNVVCQSLMLQLFDFRADGRVIAALFAFDSPFAALVDAGNAGHSK